MLTYLARGPAEATPGIQQQRRGRQKGSMWQPTQPTLRLLVPLLCLAAQLPAAFGVAYISTTADFVAALKNQSITSIRLRRDLSLLGHEWDRAAGGVGSIINITR